MIDRTRKLVVTRHNKVWAMDLTCIPLVRGFFYLCTVVDWLSYRLLSWRLAITMEADFCIEAVEGVLARYGKPGLLNTIRVSSSFWHSPILICYNSRRPHSSLDRQTLDQVYFNALKSTIVAA